MTRLRRDLIECTLLLRELWRARKAGPRAVAPTALEGDTMRQAVGTNTGRAIQVWRDDDGVYVACPAVPLDSETGNLPIGEGATPEEAFADLLGRAVEVEVPARAQPQAASGPCALCHDPECDGTRARCPGRWV